MAEPEVISISAHEKKRLENQLIESLKIAGGAGLTVKDIRCRVFDYSQTYMFVNRLLIKLKRAGAIRRTWLVTADGLGEARWSLVEGRTR